MGFDAFLTLLVVSVVVSGVLHYGLKYYVTAGTWSFVSKCLVGYFGAYWGAVYFGSWGYSYGGVDIFPAALGSAALLIVLVDLVKIWVSRGK